jgi:hypothetical protein
MHLDAQCFVKSRRLADAYTVDLHHRATRCTAILLTTSFIHLYVYTLTLCMYNISDLGSESR